MGSPPTLGSRRFSSAQRLSSVLRAAHVPRERRGAPAAATDGVLLRERTAAGVTPSRQRILEARSAGLGTAARQHHWRVRRRVPAEVVATTFARRSRHLDDTVVR